MIQKIKEAKEWFVRTGSVVIGQLRDRETTFKKQYPASSDLAGEYMIFLNEHFPNEDVFKKLFASISFILNPSDTAFEKQQGLTQKATDAKAILRDSRDNAGLDNLGGSGVSQDTENTYNGIKYLSTTNFTTAVLPHQLPNIRPTTLDVDGVKSGITTEEGNGIIVESYSVALTGNHSGKSRKNFTVKANVDDLSIGVTDGKLETKGITDTLTVVTAVNVDIAGAVTSVVTKTLTITKGIITNIS